MLGQYKKIIMLVVGIAVVGGMFWVFQRSDLSNSNSSLSKIEAQTKESILGEELIAVINRVDKIELDRSVFSSPVYNRLTDRSRSLPKQSLGRENIFSPYASETTGVTEEEEPGTEE